MAGFQPYLLDSVISVSAPDLAIGSRNGRFDGPADGFYRGDRRVLSTLVVEVDGALIAPISARSVTAGMATFRSIIRGIGEHGPDPAMLLEQRRSVAGGVLTERIAVTNAGRRDVVLPLRVRVGTDLATMGAVKSGSPTTALAPTAVAGGLAWSAPAGSVEVRSAPQCADLDVETGTLRYDVRLAPGASYRLELTARLRTCDDPAIFAAADRVPWRPVTISCADDRLGRLVEASMGDLAALLVRDGDDAFLAAGAPWYLTLFGRDSLWAARMLLPLGTDLARGTLRTLARLQGRTHDPVTGEDPGKIVHEVRKATADHGDMSLPPRYYGTIDATALWVSLLHDAWRWGLDPADVAALLPNLEAALTWMTQYGDADGDGFLEYVDRSGRGLANQGWKDSSDSIRWRNGELATAPLALCEVQAYAYEAATKGAAVLRAFGRRGADRLQEWAGELQAEFRRKFWVEDAVGAYPALALDGAKRPVDAVTSSMGHLLGTGLLSGEESALVAARIAAPALDSGFGVRTMAEDMTGFNPVGYHTGSVWPHDTAIVLAGLARDGHAAEALSLMAGVVAAAPAYDYRLPELYGGWGASREPAPTAYPASCRPQAWSAAGTVLMLQALLGLSADVPGGTLTAAPIGTAGYLPIRVDGLRVGGQALAVDVGSDGRAEVRTGAALRVVST